MSGYTEDTTAQLSAPQAESWRSVVGMISTLPAALDAQLKRDAGMNLYELQVLVALAEQTQGRLAMSDLARLTQSSPSRLSHAVARLERSGWIDRLGCTEAGKRTSATLTEEGRAQLVRAMPGHVRAIRQLVVDALEPQQLAVLGDAARTVTERAALDVITTRDPCTEADTDCQ